MLFKNYLRTEFCIKEAKKLLKQKEEVLNKKANPETWSKLQCIDHLNQFGAFYLNEIREAIDQNTNSSTSVFTPGFMGNIYAKAMKHSPKMTKMQSPPNMAPAKGNLSKEVINKFIDQQKEYLDIIKLAKNKNLNKPKLEVTISKFLKIKLGDVLRINIYHNERHIIQAINTSIKN